jgi:hypothetical protein
LWRSCSTWPTRTPARTSPCTSTRQVINILYMGGQHHAAARTLCTSTCEM